MKKQSIKYHTKTTILIIISALIQALAIQIFFIDSGLLSGGVSGISMITSNLLAKYADVHISLGVFLILLNIPLAFLGYLNVGKQFTFYSILNVVLTSFFVGVIPVMPITNDIMIDAIFGGVGIGLAVVIALEAGASCGGADIVALYMSTKKQKSAGRYMMALNGAIITFGGLFFGIEIALYTLISTFVTTYIIDMIHVRFQRVTLAIITEHGQEIQQKLLAHGNHALTVMEAKGAYSGNAKDFIYVVISTYEINEFKDLVFEIDPAAFINVTRSETIFGNFYLKPLK